MLTLDDSPFTTGRAKYLDTLPTRPGEARVYVRLAVDGMPEPFLAMLDTGAEFSVLAREIAEAVGLDAADGHEITMSHRGGAGSTPGRLVRTAVTVLADDGEDLIVDATVFVPVGEWPQGRSFIGYSGFLEGIRLGLDPQVNDIYFGGY